MAEKAPKKYRVTVHKADRNDPSPDLFLSVNFEPLQIQFGKEVVISEQYVEALKNTTVTTMVQDPHTEKNIPVTQPRYAFTAEPA